jgi:hypothetical protein
MFKRLIERRVQAKRETLLIPGEPVQKLGNLTEEDPNVYRGRKIEISTDSYQGFMAEIGPAWGFGKTPREAAAKARREYDRMERAKQDDLERKAAIRRYQQGL